ncbi:DUF4304 domain-containing protein [Paenibacillus sp. GSMTC-2017]|uniref:DUF4304 domain-containing protein n=1 Tax=Paenibacillus sp. GSMTC-2017 TaxID=2794350 RepID=UPI0018D5EF7F|nr:DUF4304 domain-containing protein [Paenibacillus sp. GSMTC-2017]MBH5317316.1 DUF4304 domain-containing protein [Paenibacillus sp. GSMTC-2017]
MDNKEFRQTIDKCLLQNEFKKSGKYYYKGTDEVICSLGLQRSSYSDCYYINVGLIIRALNPDLGYPRDVDGDIRGRFSIEANGKKVDCFVVDEIHDTEVLINSIEKNISYWTSSTLTIKALKKLLDDEPIRLFQTRLLAKKYLGIEE